MATNDQLIGNALAVGGLVAGYGSAMAQQASGIYQQTALQLNAINTLAIANVRADQEERYSAIQAGRRLKQAEIESLNYQIAGNNLLRNLEKVNAAARARAAANGVAFNEGSAAGVQDYNTRNVMRDVGVADLNALTARVLGFEDATSMLTNAEIQAEIYRSSAKLQAGQYQMAGETARKTSGLLSNVTLADSALKFAKTFKA